MIYFLQTKQIMHNSVYKIRYENNKVNKRQLLIIIVLMRRFVLFFYPAKPETINCRIKKSSSPFFFFDSLKRKISQYSYYMYIYQGQQLYTIYIFLLLPFAKTARNFFSISFTHFQYTYLPTYYQSQIYMYIV